MSETISLDKSVLADFFTEFDFAKVDTSAESMLKAGVHFGHAPARRHPKMGRFVYTTRKNINIIDLDETAKLLSEAEKFLIEVAKSGKPILFVGMKASVQPLLESLALRLGQPYVTDRWIGGTLTNFAQIRGRVAHMMDLRTKLAAGELKMYTKLEQLRMKEEMERLTRRMGGLEKLTTMPGAVVLADAKEAKLAIHEAAQMGVPMVGLVDTNADPSAIAYPIPANDDSIAGLKLMLGAIGRAVSTK
jgi:small subunit ribosomal protein S2